MWYLFLKVLIIYLEIEFILIYQDQSVCHNPNLRLQKVFLITNLDLAIILIMMVSTLLAILVDCFLNESTILLSFTSILKYLKLAILS